MAVSFGRAVPILRIFDVAKAVEFYVDWLGCTPDWQHRFDDGMPVYMQVSRDQLVLHLSEHHGDGSPGVVVYVTMRDVLELHAELAAKDYPFLNPGIHEDELGTCVELLDPFGNRLRLVEPPPD